MKRLIRHAFLCLAAGSTIVVLQSAPIPDEYIVQLKDGFDPAGISQAHGINAKHLYRHAINGFAAKIPPGQLKKLQDDPSVATISPNHEVFAYKGKPGGGGGTPPPSAEVIPVGVSRVGAAPGVNSQRGNGVGVAVLDTGLDFSHQDLDDNIGSYSYFGYGSSAQDDNGHGTHVGGIIAAELGNGVDIAGVAPGATLYAFKVLNAAGSGADDVIIDALEQIVLVGSSQNPPIRVANMSLGRDRVGGAADAAMEAAINAVIAKGITVVVAAGNDPRLEANAQVPAGFPNVVCVASTTAKAGISQSARAQAIAADTASFFTSDGSNVTVSAPGEEQEDISKSLFIQGVGILSLQLGGGVTRMSGTSMASPHVAGIVALLLESNSSLTPGQVKARLGATADKKGTAPLNSPTSVYTFDGVREGIAHAKRAIQNTTN